MNNPQYNIKESFQITDHWEVWESHVNKLKSFLFEISDSDHSLTEKNEYRNSEFWKGKPEKKLR